MTAHASLRRKTSRSIVADRAATVVLWGMGALVLALLGGIIVYFVVASWGVLSPNFLFGNPPSVDNPTANYSSALGGIFPFLWNSVYMLVLTMLIAIPLGILGGIYMSEYAAENALTKAIRFAEEAISSVPSIVVGMFGMLVFVDTFNNRYTALSGALALTLFNLPLMTRLSEQALRAVPQDERSASLALGATKWQTIKYVVVPLAIPGLITGVILTAGRVFGEAAVLLFTSGTADPAVVYNFANLDVNDPRSPWSPFHPATTLAAHIWYLKSDASGIYVNPIINGCAAILISTVLIFNLGARMVGRVLTRRLTAS